VGWDVNLGTERIGEKFTNTYGTEFMIVSYTTANDLIVRFLDGNGFEIHTTYQCCKRGNCKNPYDKIVYRVGYLGVRQDGSVPITSVVVDGKRKHTKEYAAWYNMMHRCYNEKAWVKHPTYRDCYVDEALHCFAYFLDHIHEIDGYELLNENERIVLDKDIKYEGNKVYSLHTCTFVRQEDNAREVAKRIGFGTKVRPTT
jgi:hypothetical protein